MKTGKRLIAFVMTMLMVLSCWVWFEPVETVNAANEIKNKYLFAYFTDNSSAGQTIHLAVSEDGLHYTALRNNEPVIVPSKGTGAVRDPYIWYNNQDNYYYLIATDMDASNNQWWDNCNGFIMWRSKDLVHWYDETFINVYDMLQRFDEPVGIVHRAWAPQIMWDGSSYVIYFSIDTDNVNYPADQLSIVYLKTTDLLNLDAYYEYGGILYPGYDVNDAEIVQHPTNGKWYLFYKPENGNVKINMLVSDNATGPYTSPDATNSAGLDVFSTVNEALEGGNGFFDHNGNFVLYADAFGHGSSYFYIAKTPANGDFKSWTVYGESSHNINSLSPRHGSVVPITTEEYNRLLNNAYGITSSSFPATETLADHLIARYFTTADPTYNAATGKSGELTLHNAEGKIDVGTDKLDTIGYYVKFNADTCYGVDLEDIAGENFNADDGFTITFTALSTSGENARFYEISENPGVQTDGKNHYTHFSSAGGSGGAYVENYNGPSGVAHRAQSASKKYNDGQIHEWIVSYANGNTIVYCDGEMIIKMNRFDNAGTNDDAWYAAIRNATLYIGQSGWTVDPMFTGWISDFCIYDCSMSYYDVKNIQNEQDMEAGITGSTSISGGSFGSAIPSFTHASTDQMSGLAGTYFDNILYSPQLTGMPSGSGSTDCNPKTSNGAAAAFNDDGVYFGVYYAKDTVIYLDGQTTPTIPVLAAGRLDNNRDGNFTQIYPINSTSDTSENKYFSLVSKWNGWTASSKYHETIMDPDKNESNPITTGYNSSTSGNCDLDDTKGGLASQKDRDIYYIASVLKLNENQVSLNANGYQKVNLAWHITYNWQQYKSSKWQAWQNGRTQNLAANNNNIWIVDLRDIVAVKEEIAANYDSIVTDSAYCPAIVESYKDVVAEIMKFDPKSFNYAGGAEAAIKSCLAQADNLIADYNKVLAELTAHNNGHKLLSIAGRDATCAAPGLSDGSYCEYCGEIFTAQVITDVVPHTFGAVYTVDGVKYVKCSVCGLEIKYVLSEVRYENIFDIEKWTYSASNQLVGTGTISADEKKGTITIVNNNTGEVYSRAHYDGKNLVSTRDPGNYAIPVTGGRTYILEATSLASSTSHGEVFVFQYDKDGKVFSTIPLVMAINAGETVSREFTVDENAAYIELRFDANTAGGTITYKDIGLYETEERRTYFYPGENKPLLNPTFKDGYAFDGWYTKSGAKIENTNQLSAPVNYVYSHWVEGAAVTFDANGGTGSFKWGYKFDGNITLLSTEVTRTGYKLLGWSKSQNASAAEYNAGATMAVKDLVGNASSVVLYAVWVENTYTVQYNANGGTGSIDAQVIKQTQSFTLPSTGFAWENHTFLGWSADKNATSATYQPGATVSGLAGNNEVVTLYAIWLEDTYTVQYNANGGTGSIADKTVKYADSFNLPADGFTRNGYTFLGWSANKNAKTPEYTPGQTVSKLSTTNNAKITLYAVWKLNKATSNDTVVIEYGLPVVIDVLKNDFATSVTAIGTGTSAELEKTDYTSSQLSGKADTLKLNNGNVSLKDGKITYTPTTTNTSNVDIFYYEVTVNGNYYYAKVTVIPATSMYYEDTFFTFTDAGNYKWSTVGEVFNAFQSDELDEAYGYDSAYDNNVAYSGGNVHFTTVDANVTATNGPTATFTFTGTGFDLFTVTDYDSGMVTATIYDSTGKRVQGVMANAYFGYDYNAETEKYEPADKGAIYQVPIIKARGLDYGTYTVVIAPRYNKAFDVTNAGNCKVYVDSVRIYDPMGGNSEIADEAYMTDGEYAPEYLSIRDTIVQANKDGSYANLGAGTSVYLDGGITDIENYLKNGPKSEVYLGKGNSVAFHIVTKSNVVPATIQLGMRTTGINVSTADVKLMNGEQDKWQTVTLNSTTERFYNIESGVVDWTMLNDGTYKTATPIIITNNSDAVISLTSLKWAFDGTSAQTELYVMSDETTPRIAMFAIRRAVQTEAQDTILNPENIAFSFSEDAYTVGDSGVLTVVTEQGVEAVAVNGDDAISAGTDDNDKMLWTYEFSADAVGTMTFEIVAADENGFTSEVIYATTEIKDVVVDNTPETPEDNDDSDGLGGFMNIFKSISDLINKIINILKNVFTFMMGGITK